MAKSSYTSRKLKIIAGAWFIFPLTYAAYAGTAMGLHLSGLVKLVLSPGFWFVGLLAFIAAYGILRLHWYGWVAFLLSNITIAYQTAITLAYFSEGEFKFTVFSLTLIVQLALVYAVGREIRVPYFFPRIRWWESDPRQRLSVPVKILKPDHTETEGEILDISTGGCFIKTRTYFKPNESLTLQFNLFDQPVECSGNVVRFTESSVTHPRGIGVKFEVINKENLFKLRQGARKIQKLGRVFAQKTRERNWQEYLDREQRYQGKSKAGKS